MIDAHAFSLAIRWLHVVAMAIAFGGAALLAISARSRDATGVLELVVASAVALVAGALIGLLFSGIDLILLGVAARIVRAAYHGTPHAT